MNILLRMPGVYVLLSVALYVLSSSAVLASADPLLERLRTDHAAMVAAEQDYHARRERGDLSGTEAADYASYVAGLHRRVAEDCVALVERGIAIPSGLTCPENNAALIAPAMIDQANEQTGQEATATLEAELFNGLGEFDEMLLQEQERIRAATPRSTAASDGAGSGGGDGGTGSPGSSTVAAGGEPGETTYGAGAGPGSSGTPHKSSAPPGTPDGSDDDVVARQLREAAEKETDPELKKKLWEEYRKYKEGTQ